MAKSISKSKAILRPKAAVKPERRGNRAPKKPVYKQAYLPFKADDMKTTEWYEH